MTPWTDYKEPPSSWREAALCATASKLVAGEKFSRMSCGNTIVLGFKWPCTYQIELLHTDGRKEWVFYEPREILEWITTILDEKQ